MEVISSFWSSFISFNVQKYFHTCLTHSLWKSRKSWKQANLSSGHKLHWQPVSQKPGCSFVLCVNQAATAHHKQTITSPFIFTLCLTFDHCHLHLDKPIRECQEQTRLGHDLLWCQLAPSLLQSGNPPSPTTTSTQLLTHHPQLCICQNDNNIKSIFPEWRPPTTSTPTLTPQPFF